MRQSDGKTLDIGIVRPGEGDPGGYADAAAQDAFCANTSMLDHHYFTTSPEMVIISFRHLRELSGDRQKEDLTLFQLRIWHQLL